MQPGLAAGKDGITHKSNPLLRHMDAGLGVRMSRSVIQEEIRVAHFQGHAVAVSNLGIVDDIILLGGHQRQRRGILPLQHIHAVFVAGLVVCHSPEDVLQVFMAYYQRLPGKSKAVVKILSNMPWKIRISNFHYSPSLDIWTTAPYAGNINPTVRRRNQYEQSHNQGRSRLSGNPQRDH